ncbi:phosphoribosylglycinamide formyltransferase [Faecalitalea cylindroides]|uniref:phosphoribosylglycinamide formyltransferase n=1 Tax=Faecalitalea cylindroides TaxID=39483 RepID=UPI00189BE37E|nr:phosphoribosylglycinamide formyltransferase [Faecalitalea cylindroides]
MLRLAVLISGGGTDLQSIIDEHKKGNINCEIALVISNRKSAYGLERAKQVGIPTACIKDQKELLKKLQDEKIDFIVLAGYLAILQEDLIKAYPNKIINIHPSLIPSFCGPGMYGLHVHEAALAKGVKVSGATVHFVSEEVDGGPIIYQEAVSIADLDTAEAIQKRVLEVEHKILPMVVRYYCEDRIRIEKGRVHIL